MTWGHCVCGEISTEVQEQLRTGVKHVYSTALAFAALKDDGSVVTWGQTGWGGKNDQVRELRAGVQHVYSTNYAFAAVKAQGEYPLQKSR